MPTATLVHLSGPARGTTWRLGGDAISVVQTPRGLFPYAGQVTPSDGTVILRLSRGQTGYQVVPTPGGRIWINGQRTHDRALQSDDLIEAGDAGIMLRYRKVAAGRRGRKTLRQALGDCVDCARHGGRGPIDRLGVLLFGSAYEIATQVAPIVRLMALVLLLGVLGSVAALWYENAQLRHELERQAERVTDLTLLLEGSESPAFSREDFESARSELDFRIKDTLARIEALEARSGARGRVIEEASRAVIFLQGSYGFRDPETGRALRQAPGPARAPSALTLGGDSPPLELRYTGTGFVVGDRGLVLTNRHVATPWAFDNDARRLISRGFTPVMIRFEGYLPTSAEAFPVHTIRTHPEADLAVLQCDTSTTEVSGLSLGLEPPAIGQEVIVLGYPTGMRALLARADRDFVDRVMTAPVGFWDLAALLARGGFVQPLATVGVIGQATPGSIVYDAETTHGGSGGPVLTLDGQVIAVNAAILPEFGGSNLGVPSTLAVALLEEATAEVQ